MIFLRSAHSLFGITIHEALEVYAGVLTGKVAATLAQTFTARKTRVLVHRQHD